MSKRMEQSRRHGPCDPRYPAEAVAREDGRVSVVTQRNALPRAGQEQPSATERGSAVAFRHELCDRQGGYLGTFVTETDGWQIGDVFTAGDGRTLRITGVFAAAASSERPAYADRWSVEPAQVRHE